MKAVRGTEKRDRIRPRVIRVLALMDNPADAELIQSRLSEGHLEHEMISVSSAEALGDVLHNESIDVILAGHTPDGRLALELAREARSGVPFIFVSDTPGEEAAVEALKSGAADYVMKRRPERLAPAVRHATSVAADRRGKVPREDDQEYGAGEASRKDEERFRSLLRFTSDTVMILDPEGVITYESPAVERILGFRPEDRVGTGFLSHVHPDDLATAKRRLAALLEEPGSSLSIEYRARDKEGCWHQFEADFTNLLEDPVIRGIVVNARDSTELRSVEAALRESDERFRWTFEKAAENIFLVDPKSRRILDANATLQRSLGYTLDELKSMPLHDLVADGQEGVGLNVEHVVAEGNTYVGERKYRRKDGSSIDVEINAGAIPFGDGQALCVVAHDITERKRTETELRQNLSVLLALREAGQVLSSTLESEEIVARLLEIMRSVAGLTAAVVSRFDQDGNLRVWRSAGLENLWPRVRYTPEAEGARRAALDNEGRQLFWLERPGGSADDYLAGLCLPLKTRKRTTGVLEAYGRESLADADMVGIIDNLTSQAATALENALLYEALGHRERALQNLVTRLLGAQEEERRRVSYEVHDGLAQVAVAAHQNLQAFARRHAPESEKGKRELDLILKQVRATVSDARKVIANLRPTALDDLGLAPAISLEVERLDEEGYRVEYQDHLGDERLPAEIEITLFRVLQEALTNMRKHAHTQWVTIELHREDGEVCLEVRDYGRGFDPNALETWGLDRASGSESRG